MLLKAPADIPPPCRLPAPQKAERRSAVICLGALIVKIGHKDQPGRLIGNLLRNRRKNLGKLLLPSIVSFFPLYGNIAFLFLRTRLCYVLFRFLFLCKSVSGSVWSVLSSATVPEGALFSVISFKRCSTPRHTMITMAHISTYDPGFLFHPLYPAFHFRTGAK